MTFLLINVWDLDKVKDNIIPADVRCIALCCDCIQSPVRTIKYFMYQKYGLCSKPCKNCGYDENNTSSEKWQQHLEDIKKTDVLMH